MMAVYGKDMVDTMKKQYIKSLRKASSILLAAACAGMTITGCGEEAVVEETVSEAIPVEVLNPEAGTLTLKNEFVGTVSPEEFVYVIPMVSAEVLSADVAVGDTVVAGQELCKLDSEAAQLQLASAQAQYDSVEANVDAAQVGYEIAQAQYESAVAQIDLQNEQTQRQKDLQLYQMQIQIDSINNGIDDINEQMSDLDEDKKDAEEKKDDLKKARNKASAYADQAEEAYGQAQAAYSAKMNSSGYNEKRAAYQKAIAEVTALETGDDAAKKEIIDNQFEGSEEKYEAALKDAKDDLDTAEGALKTAEEEMKYYEESLDSAKAAMSSAQSAVSQTESAYEQVKSGIESIEDGQEQLSSTLSDTYRNLEQTEAVKNMTEASLNIDSTPVQNASKKTAALGVDSAAATVNSAKVGAEGAKVAIDSAEYQLDMYTLKAPIDGVIEAVNVKEHDFASPNGPAFVISNKNTMTVTFHVSEGIRNTLHVGQKIQVDRNGKLYDAAITEIGTMIDQNTGLFAVKSCVSTPDASLLTGSSVKVIADTYSQGNAILIPYDAVYYDDSQPYVYVAVDGTARRQDVETGIFDADTITVLSGLTVDEVLITSWSANLRDGAEISVQDGGSQETAAE